MIKHPFSGLYTITQSYGITDNYFEPAGYLWPDGSITYWYDARAIYYPHLHCGVDYACPSDTRLLSPTKGRVIFASWDYTGFGYCCKVNHGRFTTLLGHMKQFNVVDKQKVKQHQLLGLSDSTGNSTGPHLHWSIIRNSDGHFISPASVLNRRFMW